MTRLGLERPDFGPDPAVAFEHLVDLDELRDVVAARSPRSPAACVMPCSCASSISARTPRWPRRSPSPSRPPGRASSRGLRALAELLQQERPHQPSTGQELA